METAIVVSYIIILVLGISVALILIVDLVCMFFGGVKKIIKTLFVYFLSVLKKIIKQEDVS